MKKLSFVTLLIFLSLSLSLIGDVHSSSVRTIGVIFSADIPHYRMIQKSLLRNLQKLGVDTGAIEFVEQRPYPDVVSWANAARKLVVYDAEIIIAYGSGATMEALVETSSIPVVYGAVYGDPMEIKKKKNSTGCSYKVSMGSFLRYLRKTKVIKDLAMIYSPFEIDSKMQFESLKQKGKELSINVMGVSIKTAEDIEMLKLKKFDALFVSGSAIANLELKKIAEICMAKGVPLLSLYEGTEEYAFLTITPDTEMQGEEMAKIIYALLKGERPHKIHDAVVARTNIYFNMRLTTSLGLKIPVGLVTGAGKVIR